VTDRLRPLWDFDDLDASERRFRELLRSETDDGARAEVLTQLARIEGLRGDFDAGERLLEEAETLAGASGRPRIRIDLERGRLRRSSGDEEAALPLFAAAFETAKNAGELFLAVDAAHMAALVTYDRGGFAEWTRRGVELAELEDSSARYWLGPLLNNLGWHLYEAGEHEAALDAFERALAARQLDPENEAGVAIARYAVGKALRTLGRPAEAAVQLEQAIAWAESAGKPDAWFHDELAEDYAALGRLRDARAHAERALELYPAGALHEGRLRELAAGP
jgi:tetratricopeptide (TPR) repeat protein